MAPPGGGPGVRRLLGGLHAFGMSHSLAANRQFIYVPMPRGRLLLRWDCSLRTAPTAPLPISSARAKWRSSNPDEPGTDRMNDVDGNRRSMWKRAWAWFDDLTGTSSWLVPLLRHPVPNAKKSAWFYVLGSATL